MGTVADASNNGRTRAHVAAREASSDHGKRSGRKRICQDDRVTPRVDSTILFGRTYNFWWSVPLLVFAGLLAFASAGFDFIGEEKRVEELAPPWALLALAAISCFVADLLAEAPLPR